MPPWVGRLRKCPHRKSAVNQCSPRVKASVGEVKMSLILIAASVAAFFVMMAIWIKRTRDCNRHQIEQHSITADALNQILGYNRELLLFDVRQPLDVLADSEIIPGTKRI